MNGQERRGAGLAYAGQLLALAVGYVLLGKLGLSIAPVNRFATLIWAPTGMSLAALLIGGYRLWPGVALGALVTNLWCGLPPLVACGIALGNTLEAVGATLALRRIPGFRASLDRFADVVALVVLAGMLSTAVSATMGTASLVWGGVIPMGELPRTWVAWWTGNLMSDVLIAPLLLTWAGGSSIVARRSAVIAEATTVGGLLSACAMLVFTWRPDAATESPLLQPHVLFLPLIWAALRHGTRGAATGVFAVATVAIWGTSNGYGPFLRRHPTESLIALHVFISSMSLSALALGSIVTERERSRRALRESESMLRTLMKGTIDAVYVKDQDGRYLIMNAAGARLFGVSVEEVTGKDDRAFFPPGEAEQLRREDRAVMQSRAPRTYEEHLTIGRAPRVYHTTKTPWRDQAGDVLGVIGISRDITERERFERAREHDQRQRLAVEAAHLGMWFWSVKTGQIMWTPLCRSLHGFGPDEEVSMERFLGALHPDDRERTEAALQRALAERTGYRIEHRVVWPDGSVHWLSARGSSFDDDAGEPERMMGIVIDVTAQKQAEQERDALLERERAALAEVRAADRAKDDFLAVLSHELRTPLQSMMGWTRILKAGARDERTLRKGLDTIDRNVATQAQLIEDLLDVSRIVAGNLRLSLQRVNLTPVVEASLQSAQSAAGARSIRLDVSIDPGAGDVFGDPDRLHQVVSNLLGNAIKFTPSGGRVGVRLERAGQTARIVVEDTGRGIAPDFLPHVFDRFRQAESGDRRSSREGLGLGLAIVHHLVELHSGTVLASSPGEGRGATFTVTLPAAGAEHAAGATERSARLAEGSEAPVLLHGVRVLVVDDDPDCCDMVETVLQQSGAVVRAVRSARAALDTLASFQPHLMLSDISMPGESGYALIGQVRAREAGGESHLAAVAFSALASPRDREEALSHGFDAHLAKPASPRDITRMAASMVRRAA